jgi:hypothetical protein
MDLSPTTGIHVAGEIEDSSNARGCDFSENRGGAGAVAPSDGNGLFDFQMIQHGQDVGCQQFIGIRPGVARAPSVTAGVNHDRPVSIFEQGGNLVTPITAVAEATMKEEDSGAGSEGTVLNLSSLMRHVTGFSRTWQRCSSACLELLELRVCELFDI